MSKKLFVGNLSFQTTNQELQEIFGEAGTVETAEIIRERDTDRSKGFGFVEMSTEEEAQAAIEKLNGKELGGRPLTVNIARPKEDRPARDGGNFNRNSGGGRGNW